MRAAPRVGMAAEVVHLGVREPSVVEEVRDGGRVVVAGGVVFVLHPRTGRFVREGDPYFGVRLVLRP